MEIQKVHKYDDLTLTNQHNRNEIVNISFRCNQSQLNLINRRETSKNTYLIKYMRFNLYNWPDKLKFSLPLFKLGMWRQRRQDYKSHEKRDSSSWRSKKDYKLSLYLTPNQTRPLMNREQMLTLEYNAHNVKVNLIETEKWDIQSTQINHIKGYLSCRQSLTQIFLLKKVNHWDPNAAKREESSSFYKDLHVSFCQYKKESPDSHLHRFPTLFLEEGSFGLNTDMVKIDPTSLSQPNPNSEWNKCNPKHFLITIRKQSRESEAKQENQENILHYWYRWQKTDTLKSSWTTNQEERNLLVTFWNQVQEKKWNKADRPTLIK